MRLHGQMAWCRAHLHSCSHAQRCTLITSTTTTRSIDEVAQANGAMVSSPLLTQLCPRVRPYNKHNSYLCLPSCGYIQWRALIMSTVATHLINEVPGVNGATPSSPPLRLMQLLPRARHYNEHNNYVAAAYWSVIYWCWIGLNEPLPKQALYKQIAPLQCRAHLHSCSCIYGHALSQAWQLHTRPKRLCRKMGWVDISGSSFTSQYSVPLLSTLNWIEQTNPFPRK